MESLLFAGPFLFGALTGATVRLTKVRDARANLASASTGERIVWGWILAGVGLFLSVGGILLQGDVASRGATTKAGETIAVECIKGAVGGDEDPIADCRAAQRVWEDRAGTAARWDGTRALLAALGTTVLGLGFGDLLLKPLAK